MSDQDILEWAHANGHDNLLTDTGRVSKALRSAYENETRTTHPDPQFDDVPMPERVPDVSGDSVTTRARGLLKRTQTKRSRTPRTRKTFPRVPVDRLIARGWEVIARTVQPVNLPVARVLHMQAPIAGLILEDEIKGTIVDRVLQPLARTEKRGETAIALVGPPVLVGILTNKPHLAPIVVPMLREALAIWLDVSDGKAELLEEREQKFKEQYGDRIDSIIEMLLTPPEEMVNDNPS